MKKNGTKIVVVLVIVIALVFGLDKFGVINLFGDDVKLSTTDVNTKIKEGVYITDVSEVVSNVMPSIVSITSKTLIQSGYSGPFSSGQQYTEGAGSGIIISNSDDKILILTNNHVVDDSSELTIQFIDDTKADAQIVSTSEKKDIAVISVKVSDMEKSTLEQIKVATLGDSDELKVGNGIIAIGNALGYGQSVTTGVVSALDRDVETDGYSNKMIQIDAAINGGNSGGALLNSKGEVVGINSAKYSSSGSSTSASIEGMGFAIPISDVKSLIEDLMNGKSDSSGISLGIQGYMTTSSNLSGYNLPTGFYISSVDNNSYASKASLAVGDIITMIDGKEVTDVNTIKNVLYDKNKGDSVTLKIDNLVNGRYQEKEVKVSF